MNSVAGDDLACTDEIKVYEDEGEEDEQVKSSENLTEDKVGLVIESEEQVPRLFDLFGRNGSSILRMPWPTDPRFASYFLPGYPAALAAVMAAMRSSASPVCGLSTTSGTGATNACHGDYSPGASGGGFLSGLASSSASPTAVAPPHSNSTFYTPPWEPQGPLGTNTSAFGSPAATGSSGDGYTGTTRGGGGEKQRNSATDDSSQTAFSGGRIPHFLANPFNPFIPFYHNSLHDLSATANAPGPHELLQKSPVDRLSSGLKSTQSSSPGMKGGLSAYPPSTHTDSHPMNTGVGNNDLWRSGQTASVKTDASLTSAGATPSSSSSSSLYAAVMAAAVASWSGQSGSTMTPATNTLTAGVSSSPNDPHGKTTVDSCCGEMGTRRNKSLDAAKNPYSPSMFAAAAAAHMHFLSAAAAAASFTSSLPTVQANTPATSNGTPNANSATTRRGEDGAISSSPSFTSSGLGRKPPSDPWMPQPANVTASKSFELGRQNSRKPNCDLETSACSPQDEASSEPDGGRLISRLKKTHIKKPLNAFMLFMKEMRPRVQEECTLKESAAINQILGKKWHELSRAEQTKYYEMARQAKELHQRLYPGWSARDNYAYHARRRHRRSRRPFPHHRHFVRKLNSSSSTINTPSKASPSGRLRSSSFHEDRKVLELPQKGVERPHSASDVYSSPIERRVTSSSPPSPPPPPQSPSVITNRVSVQQLQHQVAPRSSLMPRPSLPPSPPLPQTQLLAHTGAFVNPPQPASQPPVPPSKPASTLATNALTMSACSAFEQHYNQAGHHQQSQQQHQQHQQHPHHHQFLQLPSQRSFGYSAPSVSSAAVAVSMYASAQSQARGGPIGRSPAGYWGYLGQQMTSHPPGTGVKRNPYLSAAAAMNNDSVAAVAAVAAMAVGELSSGSMKKCRARFGLEHQNLWCKPCRRKKKCIRFISENEVDDYMPHHHSYQARSAAAAAAAAAAVAFNHHHRHHPHQQQPPPQGTNHPYGMFGAARRHTTGGNGYSGLVETTSNVSMRKQNYMQSSVSPFGNGVGGTQQRPYARQMIAQHFTIPAINNSGYAHPPLYNSYKRPFPMTTSSRQQTLGEYAYTSNSGGGGGGGYWASNSRCATTADAPANCFPSASVRFSTSEIMMSQGEPKSLAALLRETQGSNPSPSVYTSPKMNSLSHSQQGTTVATNASMVNSIPTTAAPIATNGRINNSHHMKREAPPLSFGVADVMGFRSREEGGALNTAAATTVASMSASTNTSTFRGTASPSTSCPLRPSPELE